MVVSFLIDIYSSLLPHIYIYLVVSFLIDILSVVSFVHFLFAVRGISLFSNLLRRGLISVSLFIPHVVSEYLGLNIWVCIWKISRLEYYMYMFDICCYTLSCICTQLPHIRFEAEAEAEAKVEVESTTTNHQTHNHNALLITLSLF